MNQPARYSNIIDTVEVNGCYLEEQRRNSERRRTSQKNYTIYERRAYKHRRHPLKIDTEV